MKSCFDFNLCAIYWGVSNRADPAILPSSDRRDQISGSLLTEVMYNARLWSTWPAVARVIESGRIFGHTLKTKLRISNDCELCHELQQAQFCGILSTCHKLPSHHSVRDSSSILPCWMIRLLNSSITNRQSAVTSHAAVVVQVSVAFKSVQAFNCVPWLPNN